MKFFSKLLMLPFLLLMAFILGSLALNAVGLLVLTETTGMLLVVAMMYTTYAILPFTLGLGLYIGSRKK